MYAMGWTQHTVGVQNIRTMSIIQTLLGNMGIAGGGVNALRGESNVQGSHGPGPSVPHPSRLSQGASGHRRPLWKLSPPLGLRRPSDPHVCQLVAELLPSIQSVFSSPIWGDTATKENDFGYAWLPKLDPGQNCSWLNLFDAMYAGRIKGFLRLGSESSVQRRQRQQGETGAGQAGLARECEHLRQRDRLFLERAGNGPQEASRLRSSCSRARLQWKKRGASPTAAVGLNGVTRLLIRRDRQNRTETSCRTDGKDQRPLQKGREIP